MTGINAVVLAAGIAIGFAVASALCLTWRAQDQRIRRLSLGFAARTLVGALDRLTASIETIALDPDLLREVSQCRDLAAALANVAEE